jgi:UDP-N-acetylmuramoylalanine--D-glutamate ligase
MAGSLAEAIEKATTFADAATPVLFSPACSSFDMFKNFEERGQAFKEAVWERKQCRLSIG